MENQRTNRAQSTLAATPSARRIRFGLVAVVGAISALGIFSGNTYIPGLPAMVKDLNTTTSTGQLTLTAVMFGLAAGQLVTGPLSDAFGRRRPLLLGLLAYTVVSLLCAFAPTALVLLVLRFLQGFSGSIGLVVGMAVVRDLYVGDQMVRFLAFTGIVTGAAPVLAPVVGGQILTFTTWRGIFVFLALVGLVLMFFSAVVLSESLPKERRIKTGVRPVMSTYGRLLRDRQYLRSACAFAPAMSALTTYIAASPFVLQNIHGLSPQMYSLVLGINALGGIAAGQISGLVGKRVAPERLVALGLGMILAASGILVLTLVASLGLWGYFAAFFLIGSSVGFVFPNSMTIALADHPKEAGSAAGLMGLLGQALGGMMAPVVGIAGPRNATPMVVTVTVLSVAACAAFVLMARGRRSSKATRTQVPALPPQTSEAPALSEVAAEAAVEATRAI